MSKRELDRWEARFRSDATRIVDTLVERSGQVVDATADISRPFVYKALPDVIGLPEEGREHMEAFGHMVWSTLGPPNELFDEAMADLETLGGWIGSATLRENLAPDSLGMAMFDAADAGAITDDDALLLVQTIVAASADTTVMTLSAAIRAFCEFPDQWQVLRAEPRPGAQRLRREPAVGLAVADGRAHHHHRRARSTTSPFPPASDAGCCSPRPTAIRADGTIPTGSMCGATWPDSWAGDSVCTCASGVSWRCSRPTRCCRS